MILLLVRAYKDRNGPRTRQEILNLVRDAQGLTKTELTARLGLAWGTVHHHLRVLVRERQLVQRRTLGWSRYFTTDVGGVEFGLMPLLREDLVPALIERVRQNPGIGIQSLSADLGISRKIVRSRLERLVETGLLERSEHYRPRFYIREAPGPPEADFPFPE